MHIPAVFRIRLQLNPDPDPANNLNPDPDPEDLESGSGFKLFLNTIIIFLLLLHNYQIFSSKKVNWKIECCKSQKSKIMLWLFNIFDLF